MVHVGMQQLNSAFKTYSGQQQAFLPRFFCKELWEIDASCAVILSPSGYVGCMVN